MKEPPILFKGQMVRSIMKGEKTKTRRIVQWKGVPPSLNVQATSLKARHYFTGRPELGWVLTSVDGACWNDKSRPTHCPYGLPGTRLWVRETWRPTGLFAGMKPSLTQACARFDYAADDSHASRDKHIPWRPAIHMPRWVSRITLEIESVRVERLQAISEEDAKAEGVPGEFPLDSDIWCSVCHGTGLREGVGCQGGVVEVECRFCDTPKKRYKNLWESINGNGSWEKNPWVWVIEFKKL